MKENVSVLGKEEPMFVSVLAVWPPLTLFAGALSVASMPVPLLLRMAAIGGMLILLFDISARLRDFRRVAANLEREPSLLPRHVPRYKRSWCQRTVLYWAAYRALGEEGGSYVRAQYDRMGYRWFHFFPDKTFTRESPFLRLNFWRSLIGGTPEVGAGDRAPAE